MNVHLLTTLTERLYKLRDVGNTKTIFISAFESTLNFLIEKLVLRFTGKSLKIDKNTSNIDNMI